MKKEKKVKSEIIIIVFSESFIGKVPRNLPVRQVSWQNFKLTGEKNWPSYGFKAIWHYQDYKEETSVLPKNKVTRPRCLNYSYTNLCLKQF